jgi:hypothetical protein
MAETTMVRTDCLGFQTRAFPKPTSKLDVEGVKTMQERQLDDCDQANFCALADQQLASI